MYFYTMKTYDSRRLKKVSHPSLYERSNGYCACFPQFPYPDADKHPSDAAPPSDF